MTPGAEAARRLLVEGRVQGVGFRYFVVRKALGLGLAGWVRNLPDGRVEIVCAGPPGAVDALERAVGEGPPGAAVTTVTVASATTSDEFPRPFEVR